MFFQFFHFFCHFLSPLTQILWKQALKNTLKKKSVLKVSHVYITHHAQTNARIGQARFSLFVQNFSPTPRVVFDTFHERSRKGMLRKKSQGLAYFKSKITPATTFLCSFPKLFQNFPDFSFGKKWPFFLVFPKLEKGLILFLRQICGVGIVLFVFLSNSRVCSIRQSGWDRTGGRLWLDWSIRIGSQQNSR